MKCATIAHNQAISNNRMVKTEKQQQAAARAFAARWAGRGYEKGDSQPFWIELLTEVFGIENPASFIRFEEQVKVDKTNFIDGHIPTTKVLIEQKSLGKDLRAAITQSDGSRLNPFQQAKRYAAELPYSQRPRWIVTCNFEEFLVYDMEQPNGEPESILLKNLGKEYYRLQFLVNERSEHLSKEMQVSMQAGEIVGRIYEALLAQYDDNSPEALRWLNILCVRIVFCLYAEDAGMFSHDQFHDYLVTYEAKDMRRAMRDLFDVLNTPIEDRSKYLQDDLKAFLYTNGGLFAEEVEIPQFTDSLRQTLLQNASLDFDWSEISPTIFGAVFESTLNPETRRSGGMHYTSIENIHKVIDPLFLDDLRREFNEILEVKVERQRNQRLDAFQERLASLTFLDPACGSGNFLTETYLSLRRLENELIRERYHGQTMLGEFVNPIKVSIQQFHGIEINDFAVTVATTALWISEAQMLAETERIVRRNIDFLPLKSYTNIREGNALRMDWSLGAHAARVLYNNAGEPPALRQAYDYIIGNPPFVGYTYQTKEQKGDLSSVCPECGKNIDYVAGWYYKAARLMQGTKTRAALVSTNSITQGEQVAAIWKPLFEKHNIKIDFAHRTFRWDSEASEKAHVHCVIVGFSAGSHAARFLGAHAARVQRDAGEPPALRHIFDGDRVITTDNISPYLLPAPNVFISRRTAPLCQVPPFVRGCQPTDDGNFILTAEERDELLSLEPQAAPFIRPFMMGKDFIQRKPRYCIWLKGADPALLHRCPQILKRVRNVRDFRLKSTKAATRMKAETPTLFDEIRNPQTNYVAIPIVSSENRRYIPIDYLTPDIIPGNKLFCMQDATLYHFGVLTSNVHMAWMRAVCGRLEMRYSYSNTIVYNNFPWPHNGARTRPSASEVAGNYGMRTSPSAGKRLCPKISADADVRAPYVAKIERTAQAILDARALYPNSSLADLYDELTMPPDLRKAHQENDRAVMQAYGFDVKTMTESECVAELFKMYQRLTK